MKKIFLDLSRWSFSFGTANAKFVHRWDADSLSKGKFVPVKTAFVKKEVKVEGIQIENKHILVKIDYTGKNLHRTEPYRQKLICHRSFKKLGLEFQVLLVQFFALKLLSLFC